MLCTNFWSSTFVRKLDAVCVRVCVVDVCILRQTENSCVYFFTLSLAVCVLILSLRRSLSSSSLRFAVRMFVCWFGEATVSVLNDEPTNRLVACMHRTKRSCKQFKISVPSSHTYFAVRSNNSRETVFFYNCWSSTSTHNLNHTKSICFYKIIHIASLSPPHKQGH